MDNISSWFNLRFILVASSREAWQNSRPMVKNTHSHTAVSHIEDCLQVTYKKGYKPSKSCLMVYWIEFAVELYCAAVTLLFLYFVTPTRLACSLFCEFPWRTNLHVYLSSNEWRDVCRWNKCNMGEFVGCYSTPSASNSFLKRTIKQTTCVFDFQYRKKSTLLPKYIKQILKWKKNLCLVSFRPTSLLFIGHLLCSDR